MLGAYVLAEELHRTDGNLMQAFPAYERILRPFILRQQRAAARFAGSLTPKTVLGIRVRDAVLNHERSRSGPSARAQHVRQHLPPAACVSS